MTQPVWAVRFDRWLFYTFLVLLIWAPLPLGSNRVWAIGLLAGLLGGLLGAFAIVGLYLKRSPLPALTRGWPAVAALAAFLLLLQFQLVAPWSGVSSVDPHHTRQHLVLATVHASALLLVLLLVTSGRRLRLLALALVFSGVAQALLAIMLHAAHAKTSLFYFEIDHALRTFGSFSYHNSLANYLMMTLALGIGLLLAGVEGGMAPMRGWRQRTAALLSFVLSPAMRLRLILVLMVIALVLTKSRMGNVALLLAIVALGVPLLYRAGRLSRRGLWLLLSIVAIDVAVVGQWIGFDRVAERLNETAIVRLDSPAEESLEDRSGPALHALAMVAERPLFGFGAGTFHVAFPRFGGPEIRQYYDHAHNDPVQFAAETGLVGTALLSVLVVAALRRAVQVRRAPHAPLDAGLAFGLILAIPAVLLQSTVDFHFQIPANALTFVVLLGIAFVLRTQAVGQRSCRAPCFRHSPMTSGACHV